MPQCAPLTSPAIQRALPYRVAIRATPVDTADTRQCHAWRRLARALTDLVRATVVVPRSRPMCPVAAQRSLNGTHRVKSAPATVRYAQGTKRERPRTPPKRLQ